MFDRFTERARTVVARARDGARARGHGVIEAAHVALVLFDDPKAHASTTLAMLGFDPAIAAESLADLLPPSGEPLAADRQLAFAPGAKDLLEGTLEAAASLGSRYVGTEHVLLALLETEDEPAARVLRDAGADPEAVRAEIAKHVERRPTGWRPGFDLGKVCAGALRYVTEAGLDRVGRAAMVASLVSEVDPATERALRGLGVEPEAFLEALRREIRADAES
jgi:ATP-dependent Clp protease ATP-binding subunit ClpA